MPLSDHPLRYELANELHARPFPTLRAPCHAVFFAIKPEADAARRDKDVDRAHLIALLDRMGATHPKPGATHYFGDLGRHKIKWECHTEFSTYTIFTDGVAERPFDPATFDVFPADWLADAPGHRLTSALIRIEKQAGTEQEMIAKASSWLVSESLAVSRVLDDAAIMAGDFRIDSAGHLRFAIFVNDTGGPGRLGRLVTRLTEIETYKTMSMLGLPRARELNRLMGPLDQQLTDLVASMTPDMTRPEESLRSLLDIAAELETLRAKSTFRFGATNAYLALVQERLTTLRERQFNGRQTFSEFMARRFDPAMRTIQSMERRLEAMAERANRAGELLRTRVDVERQAQNQELLESMDRRAALQLRLQKTVEGLSVVA
ncbi:MAG: DUF3422 domain-containing protein, partial [Pseudomonadota bacterium]